MKIKKKKQVEALKFLKLVEHQQKPESIEEIFPKGLESSQTKSEINEIKKLEEQIKRNDLIYESSKHVYDFRRFQTIRSFGNSIFNGIITISETGKKQSNLIDIFLNFNDKVRLRSKADKEKKRNA